MNQLKQIPNPEVLIGESAVLFTLGVVDRHADPVGARFGIGVNGFGPAGLLCVAEFPAIAAGTVRGS